MATSSIPDMPDMPGVSIPNLSAVGDTFMKAGTLMAGYDAQNQAMSLERDKMAIQANDSAFGRMLQFLQNERENKMQESRIQLEAIKTAAQIEQQNIQVANAAFDLKVKREAYERSMVERASDSAFISPIARAGQHVSANDLLSYAAESQSMRDNPKFATAPKAQEALAKMDAQLGKVSVQLEDGRTVSGADALNYLYKATPDQLKAARALYAGSTVKDDAFFEKLSSIAPQLISDPKDITQRVMLKGTLLDHPKVSSPEDAAKNKARLDALEDKRMELTVAAASDMSIPAFARQKRIDEVNRSIDMMKRQFVMRVNYDDPNAEKTRRLDGKPGFTPESLTSLYPEIKQRLGTMGKIPSEAIVSEFRDRSKALPVFLPRPGAETSILDPAEAYKDSPTTLNLSNSALAKTWVRKAIPAFASATTLNLLPQIDIVHRKRMYDFEQDWNAFYSSYGKILAGRDVSAKDWDSLTSNLKNVNSYLPSVGASPIELRQLFAPDYLYSLSEQLATESKEQNYALSAMNTVSGQTIAAPISPAQSQMAQMAGPNGAAVVTKKP